MRTRPARSPARARLAEVTTGSLDRTPEQPATEQTGCSSELPGLLARALQAVDGDAGSDAITELLAQLGRLYIRDVGSLCAAFAEPSLLEDLRSALRGRLLLAVRDETERLKEARAIATPKRTHRPRDSVLPIYVKRVDLIQVSGINEIEQTCRARLYVQCCFPNADEHLKANNFEFPYDEHGSPTFRPSANWYLHQFEFTNGTKAVDKLDFRVTPMGNDLMLNMRVEGDFFSTFDLRRFPFDAQQLTFVLTIKCAREGPVPVELRLDPFIIRGVEGTEFALRNTWHLASEMDLDVTEVYSSNTRHFPALRISASIRRRPLFFLVNVALPASLLSLMALLQFCMPVGDVGERMAYSSTLMLTIVSSKFSVSTALPAIAYLTLLDKFQLLCTVIVAIVVFEAGVAGTLVNPSAAAAFDWCCLMAVSLMWFSVNGYLLLKIHKEIQNNNTVFEAPRSAESPLSPALAPRGLDRTASGGSWYGSKSGVPPNGSRAAKDR